MYATNRAGTTSAQQFHVSALWAAMRHDSHSGGGAWLCAYVERWVETPEADAVTEALFADL